MTHHDHRPGRQPGRQPGPQPDRQPDPQPDRPSGVWPDRDQRTPRRARRHCPPLGSGIRPGPPPESGWPTEDPIPRIPRANVDPIRSAPDALAVVSAVMDHPMRRQTIVVFLDGDRLGSRIMVVDETDVSDPCTVVESICARWLDPSTRALVMATVRPRGATRPGDVDVWLEASAIAETFGIELLEWFVVGPAGPECPRDLIGEPDRW